MTPTPWNDASTTLIDHHGTSTQSCAYTGRQIQTYSMSYFIISTGGYRATLCLLGKSAGSTGIRYNFWTAILHQRQQTVDTFWTSALHYGRQNCLLCAGCAYYVPYSCLLISNKFCNGMGAARAGRAPSWALVNKTTYAPMIYTALCIMFWMRAYPLLGQVGGGWAPNSTRLSAQ